MISESAWICRVCKRAPRITIELICPACNGSVAESFLVDFLPTGDIAADHEAHIAAEAKALKNTSVFPETGEGESQRFIPEFFKNHIQLHENVMFKKACSFREKEIKDRLEQLNKRGESIISQLTKEILLQRQRECVHTSDRHWLPGESGTLNLLCSECFKVLEVKFVGTSTQRGESIGLKIVTEK